MGFAMVAGGKPDMTAPVASILLSSIAEGSIVKLNENGSPVDFYVAKHNYEPILNGTGRTLLVRKESSVEMVWDSDGISAYDVSDVDEWLNGTYFNVFDSEEKNAIDSTNFYYTKGNGDTTLTSLSRSVFILSRREYGVKDEHVTGVNNLEGQALPIYKLLYSGNHFWTRTPDIRSGHKSYVAFMQSNGGSSMAVCTGLKNIRPCFTFPSTALFDRNTSIFMGVY